MDKYKRIKELMNGFNQPGQAFFQATVASVEGNTCTVVVDGLPIPDVRLKATTTQVENQISLIPMIGTNVLVGSFSGDMSNLFVLSADEVDKVKITCNGQNVMALFSDTLQTLANAIILTPAGSGSFDPSVSTRLNNIEMAFKQIFA